MVIITAVVYIYKTYLFNFILMHCGYVKSCTTSYILLSYASSCGASSGASCGASTFWVLIRRRAHLQEYLNKQN